MKRRIVILSLILALVAIPLVACAAPEPTPAPTPTPTAPPESEEAIILNALRPWPWTNVDIWAYREFINRVNQRAEGRLVIKDMGGSEVFPSREQFAPLQSGTVDLLETSAGYIADVFPEPNILIYGFGATPDQLRAGGVFDKLDDIGRSEHGVTFLGQIGWYSANVFLTKRVETLEDLKNMKLRSHPSYDPLLKGLGIPTVTISWGEVFTGLERGVIDGMAWPGGLADYGLEEVVSFRIEPAFWRAGWVPFMANAESFDALPADLQRLVTDTVRELESAVPEYFDAQYNKQYAVYKLAGIQSIRLSNDEWLQTQQVGWENLKSVLAEVSPVHGAELVELMAQFYPPTEPYLSTPESLD